MMKQFANMFYHLVWGVVLFALGAQALQGMSKMENEALVPFAAIIGHLAWPIVALIIAFGVLRNINLGILKELFPNGGRIKSPLFEYERNAEAAGVALNEAVDRSGLKKSEPVTADEDQPEGVISDTSPYEKIISSWRQVSSLIAKIAAKHGGKPDARLAYENIALLQHQGVIDQGVADVARALFQARNSYRRLRPDTVSEDIAYDFGVSAGSLIGKLEPLAR